jgi:hypothetical protein
MKPDYKFNVHLSEDNITLVERFRRILLRLFEPYSGQKNLNDAETRASLEKWVNFVRFKHPGEVIEFYKQHSGDVTKLPDQHTADINFKELERDPSVPKMYKTSTSGIYTLEYLYENLSDRCLVIPWSNRLDDEGIVKALATLKCQKEVIYKIHTDSQTENIVKTDEPMLRDRLVEQLQKAAEWHMRQVDFPERQRLIDISEGQDKSALRDVVIRFKEYTFSLKHLLCPWGDIDKMEPEEVYKIFSELLEATKWYEFNGPWKIHSSPESKMLRRYWQLPDARRMRVTEEIDLKAFDFLLNILSLKSEFEDDPEKEFELVSNKKVKVTNTITGKKAHLNYRHFLDKLVGRKVVIAYNDFVGFDSVLGKLELAALLMVGKTDTSAKEREPRKGKLKKIPASEIEISDEEGYTSSTKNSGSRGTIDSNYVYNTHLGLFISDNGFLTHPEDRTVMDEEREWLNTFGKAAINMRTYLDGFRLPDQKPISAGYCTDLSAFLEYAKNFKAVDSTGYTELYMHIKKTIEDIRCPNVNAIVSKYLPKP